jgi:hypothetical protein
MAGVAMSRAIVFSLAAVVVGLACSDPGAESPDPQTDPEDGPPAGNPDGACEIPPEGGLADVSTPRTVVGDGSAASCTGEAVIAAVAAGGAITFDCGPDPVTITLDRPATPGSSATCAPTAGRTSAAPACACSINPRIYRSSW